MKPIVRSIAEATPIDTQWREIHADPPLEVSRQVQRISIDVPNVADRDLRPESASFVMPDGTQIKVEVNDRGRRQSIRPRLRGSGSGTDLLAPAA